MPAVGKPMLPQNRRAGGIPSAKNNGHAPYRLIERIISLSVAVSWDEAKLEWELSRIFFAAADKPGTCLCGHFPIIECCVLRNRENGHTAIVGNVCVDKFIGLPAEKLFRSLRRIMPDKGAALNAETVEYAFGAGWITEWEWRFYLDTLHKRRLSARERPKRLEVNAKILDRATRHVTAEGGADA